MALPRSFPLYLPLGEVGIAKWKFQVRQNIKLVFGLGAKMKPAKPVLSNVEAHLYRSASKIVGFKKFFISP